MRPDPKKKIDTSGTQSPLAGLGNAFAGMNVPDLPPGEVANTPAKPEPPLWKMGRVVQRRETAHRGGKTVVVVDDFATHLPACGCGGTVKDRRIEIQGDQPAKVRALLEGEGFQVAGVR